MAERANKLVESVKYIFSIPDLRNRVLFMLAMLAVYRVGSWIPTPGIDATALDDPHRTLLGRRARSRLRSARAMRRLEEVLTDLDHALARRALNRCRLRP